MSVFHYRVIKAVGVGLVLKRCLIKNTYRHQRNLSNTLILATSMFSRAIFISNKCHIDSTTVIFHCLSNQMYDVFTNCCLSKFSTFARINV